eukprot:SAG22_NODE_1211_length_5159_cov_105.112253_4_plen_247_part_00
MGAQQKDSAVRLTLGVVPEAPRQPWARSPRSRRPSVSHCRWCVTAGVQMFKLRPWTSDAKLSGRKTSSSSRSGTPQSSTRCRPLHHSAVALAVAKELSTGPGPKPAAQSRTPSQLGGGPGIPSRSAVAYGMFLKTSSPGVIGPGMTFFFGPSGFGGGSCEWSRLPRTVPKLVSTSGEVVKLDAAVAEPALRSSTRIASAPASSSGSEPPQPIARVAQALVPAAASSPTSTILGIVPPTCSRGRPGP